MQIGKQYLTRAKERTFGELRFLYLHNDGCLTKELFFRRGDLGSRLSILLIGIAAADTSRSFNDYLLTGLDQDAHPFRRDTDPILMVFDLFGNSDHHVAYPFHLDALLMPIVSTKEPKENHLPLNEPNIARWTVFRTLV